MHINFQKCQHKNIFHFIQAYLQSLQEIQLKAPRPEEKLNLPSAEYTKPFSTLSAGCDLYVPEAYLNYRLTRDVFSLLKKKEKWVSGEGEGVGGGIVKRNRESFVLHK